MNNFEHRVLRIERIKAAVQRCARNTGFYGDKILYKNLKVFDKIFVPTLHFAVEDFVTLFMGKKSCRWGNVVFGHGFDKLV